MWWASAGGVAYACWKEALVSKPLCMARHNPPLAPQTHHAQPAHPPPPSLAARNAHDHFLEAMAACTALQHSVQLVGIQEGAGGHAQDAWCAVIGVVNEDLPNRSWLRRRRQGSKLV